MRIAEVQPAFAYKPGLPRALVLGDWGQIQCRALQGHKPLRDALCASMGIRDLTSGKAASRKCEVFWPGPTVISRLLALGVFSS